MRPPASNQANVGNWYTPDIPLPGDVYAIGHDAGVSATAAAVERAIEAARGSLPARDGDRQGPAALTCSEPIRLTARDQAGLFSPHPYAGVPSPH